MRRSILFMLLVSIVTTAAAAPLSLVTHVDFQPLHAQAARLTITLAHLGAPLSEAEVKELDRAPTLPAAQGVALIQTVLDHHALFGVGINPEMRVKVAVGEGGSELRVTRSGKETNVAVHITAKVAALLDEKINAPAKNRFVWQIERARLGESREVPLELIVNGMAVARQNFLADGKQREVSFDAQIARSSWVALRILPSSHSNPVFVIVDGRPIRERRSLDWCLQGVDQCWSQKERFIKAEEKADALAAYEHARVTYRQRIAEAE